MPAASHHRRLLVVTAIAVYGLVLLSFLLFEVPGHGLGHFFYIPVALLALAGGTRIGLLAGVIAAALYALAIALTPRLPTADILTAATAIRLITYCSCGVLVGWFANPVRYREAKSQSPERSPVKIRPVRLPPWAAGASPITTTRARGSPKPGSGRAQ